MLPSRLSTQGERFSQDMPSMKTRGLNLSGWQSNRQQRVGRYPWTYGNRANFMKLKFTWKTKWLGESFVRSFVRSFIHTLAPLKMG
jgi:hypothetical protein